MRVFAPLLIVFALFGYRAHVALDAVAAPTQPSGPETMPSLEALGFMSLGYTNVVADYYWLRAIGHFGDMRMHKLSYPNLGPLLTRVVNLDPYFLSAYVFAGTTMTQTGHDYDDAMRILEQGMRMRPDDWKIPFLLGFNRYYYDRDYARAAVALAAAARIPGAPPATGPLAVRLLSHVGDPENGLRMLDELRGTVTDPKLLATYNDRRTLLLLELQLKFLNEAAARFAQQTGARARDLQELVRAGLLKEIPPEALGGQFLIDAQGNVSTTNEDKRLRLAKGALGHKP